MAQLHELTATVGFQSTIKPFFTACYRTHMLQVMQLDLWDGAAVQSNWGLINTAVTSGGMPRAGCPEGVWDPATKTLFLSDFLAWKNAGYPADAAQATRFNITRTQNIGTGPDTTPWTNSQYQKLLAAAAPNSPWQYYQLVMTQWPTPGSTPSNPGIPDFTIPGSSKTTPVLSSFSNVTMETFDQGAIFSGCMNCHNITAHPNGGSSPGNDFLWSLAVNAFPLPAPPSAAPAAAASALERRLDASSAAAFEALNALLRSAKSR